MAGIVKWRQSDVGSVLRACALSVVMASALLLACENSANQQSGGTATPGATEQDVGVALATPPDVPVLTSMVTTPLVASYPGVQEKGDVRVTLLSLTRSVSFRYDRDKSAAGQEPKAMALFQLTYLVECLGETPIDHLNGASPRFVWPSGEQSVSSANESQSNALKNFIYDGIVRIPKVEDWDRATVDRFTMQGRFPDGDFVNITIREGFNDNEQEFHFTGVPVP